MKIKLGQKYRDKVTGFEGIATGIHEWMTGCNTVTIQPAVDKDGKIPETHGFDENRLEFVLEEDQEEIKTDRTRGGPQDTPKQNCHK